MNTPAIDKAISIYSLFQPKEAEQARHELQELTSSTPDIEVTPPAHKDGVTLVRVFGSDQMIVGSAALMERQDHTFKNRIREVVLVLVQERK